MANQLLATLAVVCPGCDELNVAGSSDCAACGAPVQARSAAQPTPAEATVPLPRGTAGPGRKIAPPGMRVAPPRPSAAAPKLAPVPGAPAAKPITVAKLLLTVLGGSQEGRQFPLTLGTCGLGRSKGAVLFPDDPTLSAHQATLFFHDGRVHLRDEGAVSGVFVRVSAPERLLPRGQFSAGQRLFRYLGAIAASAPGAVASASGRPLPYGAPLPAAPFLYGVEELLIGGRSGRVIVSGSPVLKVGQRGCDLSYPGDTSLAALHCELTPGAEFALLRDHSGELGTFVRLPAQSERVLQPGDSFRVGQQILKVEPLV